MSRIRANQITNQSADGAPTVQNGLVISGVTTSTTFSGSGASLTNLPSAQLTGALPALDGSNLTGLSGVSVANQADNRLITATGTTDALNGEANLTYDGSKLTVTSSSKDLLYLNSTHSSGPQLPFQTSGTTFAYIGSAISLFSTGSSTDLGFRAESGKHILFGIGGNEKVRINSSGQMGLGGTPTHKLEIFNAADVENILMIRGADATTEYAAMGVSGGNAVITGGGVGSTNAGISFRTAASGTEAERLRITSSGNFGIATNSPVAQTLAGGTAITPVLDLKGTSQNNTSGVLQFTRKDNSTQGSCIYSSGDDAGLTFRNTDGNGFGFYTGTTLRFRIDPNGYIKFGESNSGNVAFSLVTNGSGMLLSRATTGNPNNGQTLGDVGFNAYSDSQTTSSADALIRGQADGNFSGSSAPSALLFFTKPASTGPGSSPTERMRINKDGIVTQSQQPSFAAFRNSGAYGLNNEIFPLGSVRHNVGNHYNTSNYRFTAPVAGRYLFTFYSIINSQINSGYYEIKVNNSAGNGQSVHFTTTNTSWDHVSSSHLLNLSANDYVTMWSNSNVGWHGGGWQLFCGELLS